jgi:hypothetical protein
MGQNYHLVHHLWPSIPWYHYERAYYATKPLLDAKGCDQSLGIFQSQSDFLGFVYDALLGIRLHHAQKPATAKESGLTAALSDGLPLPDLTLPDTDNSLLDSHSSDQESEEAGSST